MKRAERMTIEWSWATAQRGSCALRAVWSRASRYYSLLAFGVVLSIALTACGGGGGGGGGGNRQILNGAAGIRNFSNQNPRAGSLVNNIGQAQNTLGDYTARPINPGSRRKITPQEALLNASNALTDDDTIDLIKQNYPNWSSFLAESGNDVTIDFDNTPGSLDEWLSGLLDSGSHGVISLSRQARPKLFKGRMTVRHTATSGNTKEIQVTCPEDKPLQVNPESSNSQTPKLKLVGNLKAKLPTSTQPGDQAQGQIDYDRLKVENLKTARGNRPGDTIILGNEQKQEWSAIALKLDQEDDAVPSFDIAGMDWESTELAWLDDDLLQYFAESIADAYLTWTLQSEGLFYIYDDVDDLDCAGYYGADWSFQPLPRNRRQAELLLPFNFDWDDTFEGCGAVDDYQLVFIYNQITYVVQSLEENEYVGWCEETDSELDAYLAALLNLPPGADLADTVLTAEAWATGLPQFMYFLYQLHNSLANPASGVSIAGDYPSSYAATFTNFAYGDNQLNGKISFEFSSSDDTIQLTAVFESGFTWDDVALTGTLKMILKESTGQMTIEITNFSWNIPEVSQGSVPSGTLSAAITLENDNLTSVRTSALNMRLNVRNLLISPPQTYNVTLGVARPLEWPVNDCFYSTSGVLTIRGQVVGQLVEMQVDFGADGECGKAVITSGGLSATYNLETGLFESLSRLRSKTRALPQPRSMRFWHKPTPRS
jgi:hypothetical protein